MSRALRLARPGALVQVRPRVRGLGCFCPGLWLLGCRCSTPTPAFGVAARLPLRAFGGAMPIAEGTQYWVLVDGVRTVCMYLKPTEVQSRRMHLVAVPARAMSDPSPRDREVRSAQGDVKVVIRILLIANTSALRRTRSERFTYADWSTPPRLDDVMHVMESDPRALPLQHEGAAPGEFLVSDTAEDAPSAEADVPHELATAAAALLAPVSGDERPDPTTSGRGGGAFGEALLHELSELRRGQERGLERISALERASDRTRRPQTGVFDDTETTPLSPEDRQLIASLRAARPAGVGAEPPRGPTTTTTAPLRLGATASAPADGTVPRTAQGDTSPREDLLFELLNRVLEDRAPSQPRHGASPLVAGLSDDKLFKMEGARGRLAQDRLELQLKEQPRQVILEFEEAVRREAPPEDPSEKDITLGQLQRAWRQTVPAKEHPLAARVAEALLHVYHHLRAGRLELGMARLALLLAALEQGVRDNGRFDKRADLLACMPPPPLTLYHPHSQEERQQLKDDKKGLGAMARLVGATRATTARAVYLENYGA